MKLYTILLNFQDRTVWIEQYYAESPKEALLCFIEKAECLNKFNRNLLLNILLKRKNIFIHISMWIKWVWIMDFWTDLIDNIEFSDIMGGYIIQTDKDWEMRKLN